MQCSRMFPGLQNVAQFNEISGAPVQIFQVQVRNFSSNAPLILFKFFLKCARNEENDCECNNNIRSMIAEHIVVLTGLTYSSSNWLILKFFKH